MIDTRIHIILNKNQALWKPGTNVLLKEGDTLKVSSNTFWRRRLKDGSISIHKLKKSEKTEKAKNKNKEFKKEPSEK